MIGPFAALETYVFKCFTVSGRASRAEYWWPFLILMLIAMATIAVDGYTIATAAVINISPFAYLTPYLFVFSTIANFTCTIRRLHDSGRSGFAYMWCFVPLVGIFMMLWFLVVPSEDEDNAYGPPPGRGPRRDGKPMGKGGKRNPFQGYAVLDRAEVADTPEVIAARRAEIASYYQARVLKQPVAAP
jgi:uncharacterized membrane protein YhaH (DUF805 family)